ncbi:PqqD family peptide modification chaperone [Halomonas zhaodongensis]|uniref:PqqD family peptide modification chaperone n=2 Tax=Vreelandella zhaodongensis TaxID=1176240 RepID=A0ABX2SP92_VREZH|nr:PqqD family peptide modification chaperone [Halomonas zhaodongensis]
MMTTSVVVDYALENLGPCLRLVDAQHLLPVIHRAMPGWRLIPCEPQQQAPDICVWRHPDGFWQEAPALPDGMLLDTPVGTACSVIADVTGAYLHGHPQLIGIHCGAVEINNQLVIFPDSHRAGKSTLTAAFAAAGCRVFGDDVLALNSSGEGIALGVAPRLRLPLPETLAPEFHQFVANHLGPHDDRYGYLALSDQQQAQHGSKSPLGGVLLIDRDTTLTAPQLVPLQPGDGLWQLLQQNFAEHESDQTLIERFLPLLQRLPCFLLRYRDAYEAAQWLTAQWADTSLPAKRMHPADSEELTSATSTAVGNQQVALEENDKRCWQACKAAYEFPLGDELFVIAKEGGAIHRLNVTSRAVWALLEHEALSIDEITDTLVAFFAGANRESVERDISHLLGQLVHAGLVQTVPG